MNKNLFERKIKNNFHEYLYFPNNKEISENLNCYGCLKYRKSYTVYHINSKKKFIFLGVFNNESDAYEYLDEIMEYLHLLEIDKILDEYFNLSKKEKLRYREMIDFYLKNDPSFKTNFGNRIKEYKKLKNF